MTKRICAAACALLSCVACGAGEVSEAEKKVRAGLLKFREEMRSDDEKVRTAAFDRVMVDKALLGKLLGKDAALVWPKMEKPLAETRKNTARMKSELDAKGDVKEVKLTDVRKSDASGRYRLVLAMIPRDIPAYTAVTRHEKGSAGSSTYMFVDGRMRWVPGLEGLCLRIQRLKSKASRRKAKFPDLSGRFLAALRSEKLAEAMACWVSVKEFGALMASPPPEMPKPSAAEVKEMAKYFRERDAVLAKWFPNLIKALKAEGLAPKDLKYADSEGTVNTHLGFEKTSSITMTFAGAGGARVRIRIDDGFKFGGGKWRFSDKPLNVSVEKDGKTKSLDVKEK